MTIENFYDAVAVAFMSATIVLFPVACFAVQWVFQKIMDM